MCRISNDTLDTFESVSIQAAESEGDNSRACLFKLYGKGGDVKSYFNWVGYKSEQPTLKNCFLK